MNREALIQLRRVVLAAPRDLLHMRSLKEKSACGTARCAFWWARIDPWFKENTYIHQCVINSWISKNRAWISFYRASFIFDISREDTTNLFGGNLELDSDPHAVSVEEVIWNIDELLAGRRALPYAASEASPPYAGKIP